MIKTFLKTTAALATLMVGSNVWGAYLSEAGDPLPLTAATVKAGKYANKDFTSTITTTGAYTLEKGKYNFFSNADVSLNALTLVEDSYVVFEGSGDVTLTSAVLPDGKKATIVFNNTGTVTWATANPSNAGLKHSIVFGPACTGLTAVAASFGGVLEVQNLDFALTSGPTGDLAYKRKSKVAPLFTGSKKVYLVD